MKPPTIGILAGMGPQSTGPFVDLVVAECRRQYGARHDIDFPKMMICSQPAPFYEDRPVDHAALEAATLSGLRDLEHAGVDFAAMACNTVHIYYESLAAQLAIPLLNMVEIGVEALSPETRTVALIAARPTVESGIYQDALWARGFGVLDAGWQDQVDDMLGLIRRSPSPDELSTAWRNLLDRTTGADAVLVACLDLTGTLAYAPRDQVIADAAQALAERIISTWLDLRP